jgi:hypothetical protein
MIIRLASLNTARLKVLTAMTMKAWRNVLLHLPGRREGGGDRA